MTDAVLKPKRFAGIDEAGRGCVIGPMAIAIVSATDEDRAWLEQIGVKDSKKLSPKKREALAVQIRERCWHRIAIAQPIEIDAALQDELRSLNTLEQELMSALIREFQETFFDHEAHILSDAISRIPEHHAARLRALSIVNPLHVIESRIAADDTDKVVGAASILAKSERERLLSELQSTSNIDFGSGYASDKKAINFVRQCDSGHPGVRWSWKIKI